MNLGKAHKGLARGARVISSICAQAPYAKGFFIAVDNFVDYLPGAALPSRLDGAVPILVVSRAGQ
jgi:hypothetical protein